MPFFSDKEPVSDTLFNDRPLSQLIEMQRGKALEAINEYSADQILNTPTEDIVESIVPACRLEVPVLHEDAAYQDTPKEIVREMRDHGRNIRQPGFEYKLTIYSLYRASWFVQALLAIKSYRPAKGQG
jgi:hypothetical protein